MELGRPCHGELYADTVLPMWAEYPERASKCGVEVVNASPGSAIAAFRASPLDQLLEGDQ